MRLIPTNVYVFKVNNRNSRKRFEIYSKLVFLLFTLNIFQTFFYCSLVDFEQVNVSWDISMVRALFYSVMKELKG